MDSMEVKNRRLQDREPVAQSRPKCHGPWGEEGQAQVATICPSPVGDPRARGRRRHRLRTAILTKTQSRSRCCCRRVERGEGEGEGSWQHWVAGGAVSSLHQRRRCRQLAAASSTSWPGLGHQVVPLNPRPWRLGREGCCLLLLLLQPLPRLAIQTSSSSLCKSVFRTS